MSLLSAMTIFSKINATEAGDLTKVFFMKYYLLHQDNFLAHLLCHVTFVTAFNKCSDPDVKLANLLLFILQARQN